MTTQQAPPALRAATAADVAFLAWGINEAAGGLFRTLFGSRAPAVLQTVMVQPGHTFSYEHAVVAERSGRVVGFCQGYPHGTPSGELAIAKAAGPRAARAAVIGLLGLPVVVALGRHDPGEWYLQAIAVSPAGRGSGTGSALFADAFRRARAARSTTLALDVDTANTRAIDLYLRLGLRVAATSRRAVLLGDVSVSRMTAPVLATPRSESATGPH